MRNFRLGCVGRSTTDAVAVVTRIDHGSGSNFRTFLIPTKPFLPAVLENGRDDGIFLEQNTIY